MAGGWARGRIGFPTQNPETRHHSRKHAVTTHPVTESVSTSGVRVAWTDLLLLLLLLRGRALLELALALRRRRTVDAVLKEEG